LNSKIGSDFMSHSKVPFKVKVLEMSANLI
jgi:hypothetical protein